MSENNKMNKMHIPTTDVGEIHTKKYEECVLCGEITNIPIDMPIYMRCNFVIGCGQLCTRCSHTLMRRTTKEFERKYKNK